ncbi:MAG TPA: hypothetical protein VN922_19595 [Bacteroidia bacterium]|nr:hypothetical protein [Bacteroidia bacterium]
MYFDLAIIETGNGGDLQKLNNDLSVVYGIQNMPYLSMFGGNVKQSTKQNTVAEQSFDYWANTLMYDAEPDLQMNSLTERTYKSVALNSQGRILIEAAIKEDLKLLSDVATVTITTYIISDDRIDSVIKIMEDIETIKIIMISFKKTSDGDFFLFDFNDDFFL